MTNISFMNISALRGTLEIRYKLVPDSIKMSHKTHGITEPPWKLVLDEMNIQRNAQQSDVTPFVYHVWSVNHTCLNASIFNTFLVISGLKHLIFF